MAEESASIAQRLEALEQISHARVVERVGQIEQRMSRIESAREAEEPHVATKADIARLETLIVGTRSDLQGQIGDLRADMQAEIGGLQGQIGSLRADMQAEIGGLRADMQAEIGGLRADMQAEIGGLRADMQAEIGGLRADMQAEIGGLRADMQRQMGELQSDLEDKINAVNTAGEKRLRHFLMWLIGTAIALAAVIIAAFAIIVGQML